MRIRSLRRQWATILLILSAIVFVSCRRAPPTIAVIPRTCGTFLWESEHAGAEEMGRARRLLVYWNAPMREDDVEAQIALLGKTALRGFAGIILTPDETLPLRTPVRRIVALGIPVVIVGTDLGMAPNDRLSYVLNDDEAGGEMAAHRVGEMLHGQGSVAIIGINPQLTGVTLRERSLEHILATAYPKIHIAARRRGYYSVPQEQQVAEELLYHGEPPDGIVALSQASTRGAFYALVEFDQTKRIKLVGFDQDLISPVRSGGIDSIVMQNTYEMGRTAMELMDRNIHGQTGATKIVLQPVLMTRDNMDSPEIVRLLNQKWWTKR